MFTSSNKRSWSYAIQYWYDEVNNFQYGKGSTNEKEVGHYTQVQLVPTQQHERLFSHFEPTVWQKKGADEFERSVISTLHLQVVWYRSNQVGCAMATCPGGNFYVCQYCPP